MSKGRFMLKSVGPIDDHRSLLSFRHGQSQSQDWDNGVSFAGRLDLFLLMVVDVRTAASNAAQQD